MTRYVGRIDMEFNVEDLLQAIYMAMGDGWSALDADAGRIEIDLNDGVFFAGTLTFSHFTPYDRDKFAYGEYNNTTEYITQLEDFENGTDQVMKLQAVANHTDGVIYSSAPVLRDTHRKDLLSFDFGMQYRDPKS